MSLDATLQTSIILCERFASSLAPNAAVDLPPANDKSPSPLILLGAAATALKSQVTKLSLLTITAPFTPSAVTTCLNSLNESILTSLVTAALLTTPELFTPSYSADCRSLAAALLRDIQSLLRLVEKRNGDGKPTTEVPTGEKKTITEATGRVWDDCDRLGLLAKDGVPGYVLRKSKQWLDLMKDAVKELEEWDPEENFDDEDPFGENPSDDEDSNDANDTGDDSDRVAISAGVKVQALKVLNRIPQSIHVVVKQRLEKLDLTTPASPEQMKQLDTIQQRGRLISELIDESAEGMYLGNLELCLKKAGEARALTIEVVESVIRPLFPTTPASTTTETKEDKFIKRALEWIMQVNTGPAPQQTTAQSPSAT